MLGTDDPPGFIFIWKNVAYSDKILYLSLSTAANNEKGSCYEQRMEKPAYPAFSMHRLLRGDGMTIHVVTPGQTLYGIAEDYGTAVGLIAQWNGLRPPYALAVGQSLLILEPTQVYTVQEGDTLSSISRSSGIPVLTLWQNNPGLGGRDRLYPGQTLVLRYRDTPQRQIEVNGYAYPFVEPDILRAILPYTTYLTPFTYGIRADGGLVPLEDGPLLALARQYGVAPLMHLSTLTEDGTFSTARGTALLASAALRDETVQEVLRVIQERGYRGLDLDFEFLGGENAGPYADFAAQLRAGVNALGYPLITALAPKTSETQPGLLYEGHDYRALAESSDAVLLMTYEWGYTYGPPMAVSPIQPVRRVIEYALTRIPASKIFLGISNYGYDFVLPYVQGLSMARSISVEEAIRLAGEKGAEIEYDETVQAPFFRYTQDGAEHQVWFEDARSLSVRLRLLPEYGLRGALYWNFMRPNAQNLALINSLLYPQTLNLW